MLQLDACPCEGGFVLVADRRDLLEQHVWVTWVAGLWHHGVGTQSPSFNPGQLLALVPEPTNPYDEHAVGIWNADRSLMIGYVGKMVAHDMTPTHRVGITLLEHVVERKRTGLLIAVSREPLELREVRLEPEQVARHLRQLPRMPTKPPPTKDPVEAMWRMVGGGEP